jgi:hypothetical protein
MSLATAIGAVYATEYTPSQARSTWTFSQSQLYGQVIGLYFTPIVGNSWVFKVRFNSVTWNSTNSGYVRLLKDNASTTPFAQMLWNDALITYGYYESGATIFTGLQGYSNKTHIGTTAYDVEYYNVNGEYYAKYYADPMDDAKTETTHVISSTWANASHMTVDMQYTLTAGSVTFTLIPVVNMASIYEYLMIGVVLSIVFGSMGAVAYKKRN